MPFELFASNNFRIADRDHPSLSDASVERHTIDGLRVSDEVEGSVEVSSRVRRDADRRYVAHIASIHIREPIYVRRRIGRPVRHPILNPDGDVDPSHVPPFKHQNHGVFG